MSAECNKCGSDLVYAGEWPQMKCPVCTRSERVAELEALLRKTLNYIGGGSRTDEEVALYAEIEAALPGADA